MIDIQAPERQFLPKDFTVQSWEQLEPYFTNLVEKKIDSFSLLKQWLKDISELESAVSEEGCWRHIKMTCDTGNAQLEESFNYFCLEIQTKIQPVADILNKKLLDCPHTKELDKEKYFTYLRNIKKSITLFREQNVPLLSELNVMQMQYGAVAGKMTVEVEGKEYTLQQASKFLENHDRSLREKVYRKVNERRIQDKDTLNKLYTALIEKRNTVATNAGFDNYRDYKFAELGRFDYTKKDCYQFHESVKLHVMPLIEKIHERKRQKLNLDTLRPWDIEAEAEGITPLRPFKDGKELLDKTVACFNKLNPFFADCIATMNSMGRLDLESRKNKAPGGYNCPLAETGAPFIFMNASGQMSDVITMVHEGGHAVHSFLTHELELSAFKEYPMEIAEVASMSMELFSMKYWDTFFDNEEELNRAKEHQLERVITIFPWIATIDKFQHWIYEHPAHTEEDRRDKWIEILNDFSVKTVDVSGLEEYRSYSWQKQLHLFEVPFYYIEYGIAQLGAIGMYMQFQKDPKTALQNYKNALSLGGTKTLPELYKAAGLKFDFSPENIKELILFISNEMANSE